MIIFVGDRPSSKMKPGAKPFQGAACEQRLYKWIKEVLPPPHRTNWEYPAFKIYNAVDKDIEYWLGAGISKTGVKFVALGNNASKFLNLFSLDHFKLPHPSGRNRKLNDQSYIDSELKKCYLYLKG